MAISPEKLSAIINGHAKTLCSESNNKAMDTYKTNSPDSGYFEDPDPYSFNDGGAADKYDAMLGFGDNGKARDLSYTTESAERSNMPDFIKKSMLNERINVSTPSVLDGLNVKPKTIKNSMNEQVRPRQSADVQPQMNGGFDANYLKFIVKECLDEYFSKSPLNESVNGIQTIGLAKGYISIVDNKGDVYKAKLEKVGNTKKQQQ